MQPFISRSFGVHLFLFNFDCHNLLAATGVLKVTPNSKDIIMGTQILVALVCNFLLMLLFFASIVVYLLLLSNEADPPMQEYAFGKDTTCASLSTKLGGKHKRKLVLVFFMNLIRA